MAAMHIYNVQNQNEWKIETEEKREKMIVRIYEIENSCTS